MQIIIHKRNRLDNRRYQNQQRHAGLTNKLIKVCLNPLLITPYIRLANIRWSTVRGLGISSRTFSPGPTPEKNANNVVEIEAGMIKQYFSSRSWIDETIRC